MSLGIVMAATVAAVQPAAPEDAPPPAAVAGVTSYPSGFFTPFQPNTALDMVGHLPGFALDTGNAVRGYAGAAGNVLVDGVRPTSKDDALDEILKRIPVSSVLRVELIRGGAPGIDMQGKTVLANIVRRKDGKSRVTVTVAADRWYDGRIGPATRLEGAKSFGATDLEASFFAGRGVDDGAGNGARTQYGAGGGVIASGQEHSAGNWYNYKVTLSAERPTFGGKLKFHGSLNSSPYKYLQDDHLVPSGEQIENDRQSQQTAEVGLNYDHPLGGKASVETVLLQQLGLNDFTSDFAAPGDLEHFFLGKNTSESIVRVTFKASPAPSLSLEAGGEGDYNALTDRTLYTVNGAAITVPAANVHVTEKRGEGFATATWRMRPTLSLEAGVRVEASKIAATGDVVSGRAFVFAKPRAVITWSPNDDNQIRVRVEREVGQLNFDDFAAGHAT